MRKEERVIKYFTQKELKKIFTVIEKSKDNNNRFWLRDLVIFQLWYFCGMRSSEVWLLKLENYNIQSWELFIKRLKGSLNNTIRLDKTRKNLLGKYIREYKIKDSESHLFISRNNRPVSGVTITYLAKKYLTNIRSISNDKKHFHILKHTICINLCESKANLQEVREYLWHKRIESTLVYFAYTTSQQDDFYKKIKENNMLV